MDHLKSVCMDYKTHFVFSTSLSFLFLKASVCAFIHAIFPFVLIQSSTYYTKTALRAIQNSGCK